MSREMLKALAPLARRIRLMAARAILTIINDATKMQGLQVKLLDGEVCNNVDRVQNYGFTSVPLPGAEGIYLALGGSRDHGVVIVADDRRYRLKGLQGGEVALYTDEGDKVVLKRGNVIEITAATKVRMVTPLLEVTGEIKDRCDDDGMTMEGMRQTYDIHVHPENDGGGPTDPPIQQM